MTIYLAVLLVSYMLSTMMLSLGVILFDTVTADSPHFSICDDNPSVRLCIKYSVSIGA